MRLEKFAREDFEVDGKIISDLIEGHKQRRDKMIRLYKAYKGEGLEIQYRVFKDKAKINNKLVNPYRKDIIDQVVGYLFGEPILYQVLPELLDEKSKAGYDRVVATLTKFRIRNNLADLDAETGKMASICGYGARLLYIDTDGNEAVMNVKPWEVIFIDDPSINEVQYALRYYYFTDTDGEERIKAEWYDNKNITYYIQGADGKFYIDTTEGNGGIEPHLFEFVPLVKFKNNDEEMGDFEQVESLIDAYDRIVSDTQNEIEEFRQAYMYFKGVEIDKDTIERARQTGAFKLPENGDAGFLTKNINDILVENQKKTLNDNIYKFAQAVDMQDEKFSDTSGEARKWKLLALENKAIIKERKFTKALRQQFKILESVWRVKAVPVNYEAIDFAFGRNLPIDLKYLAESVTRFKGIIPDRKLLELLPFIDDIDAALKELKEMRDYYEPADLDHLEDNNEDNGGGEV